MENPRGRHFADEPAAHDDDVLEMSGSGEIELDPIDCFGIGYSDPLLEENDAKRALLNGFIHLDYLIGFLAEDEGLDESLPALWDFFECHKMPGVPETVDLSNPLLAWRKLVYVWVGFVDPATGSVLPPFRRLQAYDYDPGIRDFIETKHKVYPEFIHYLKIEDIERLFRELSHLLEIDLKLPVGLATKSSDKGHDALQAPPLTEGEGAGQVPTISFYSEGDYWRIGFAGREKWIKHHKGFIYLHTLLKNPNKEVACVDLYHGSAELLHHPEGDMSNLLSDEDKEVGGFDCWSPEPEREIFAKQRALFDEEIERLLEERAKLKTNLSMNPEMMVNSEQEINGKIDQLKNYMNRRGTIATAQDTNARTNIQRNIKMAVDAILSEIPELKPYLNMKPPNKTVKTGGKCSYIPDPNYRVNWNLCTLKSH